MRKGFFCVIFAVVFFSGLASPTKCAVYFTGIGCPHCAVADPFVLTVLTTAYPELVIIEYEVYQDPVNAPLIYSYDERYGSGYGIPLLIAGNGEYIVGDYTIMDGAQNLIERVGNDSCPLQEELRSFEALDLSDLEGNPKIWANGRGVAGLPQNNSSSELAKEFLFEENVSSVLEGKEYEIIEPVSFPLSGAQVNFDGAVMYGSMRLQWTGEGIGPAGNISIGSPGNVSITGNQTGSAAELMLPKVLSLAAVDAVNPCALAVLALMLISIITYNPEKKRNIMLAGLAFTASVFVMYLVYGLIIIKFFQLIQAITSVRLLLYNILGVAAVLLGFLNIKDFVRYKPGGFVTEMPMFLRPRVQKIISGITSPRGAFLVGLFVTVFLLPCTIGPYVITGGMLSVMELLSTIPWLLVYNAIFVSPMVAITCIVYFGMATVENVSEWKEKNIRYLHLVAGTIILLLGIGMMAGWL